MCSGPHEGPPAQLTSLSINSSPVHAALKDRLLSWQTVSSTSAQLEAALNSTYKLTQTLKWLYSF